MKVLIAIAVYIIIAAAVYIIIAAAVTFALFVASVKTGVYDPDNYDVPWPVLSGIFWPLAAPIAAAFIAANWFLNSEK